VSKTFLNAAAHSLFPHRIVLKIKLSNWFKLAVLSVLNFPAFADDPARPKLPEYDLLRLSKLVAGGTQLM